VGSAIEAMGAEEQVEFAQGWTASARSGSMERAGSRPQGSGVVRRKSAWSREERRNYRREELWRAVPKELPDFREAKGLRCEQKFRAPGWEWADRPQPEAGSPTSIRVGGEGYSTPIVLLDHCMY